MHWLINTTAIMVIPLVLLSFRIAAQRAEFAALKESGQAISLRMSALFAGYQRPNADPLRAAHIRMARIGFLHWGMMLVGLMLVFIAGMSSLLLG